MTTVARSDGLADQIAELTARHGSARLRVSGQIPPLPDEVVAALVGATAEALRNCMRHAPGSSVQVLVRAADAGVTVTIDDDGPGMTMDVRAGFGFTHSINERMVDVGGLVSLQTEPGSGSTIGLSWHPQPGGDLHDALLDLIGTPRRWIGLLTVPLLAGSWYLVLTYGMAQGNRTLSFAVAAACTALAALVVASAGTRFDGAVGLLTAVTAPVLNVVGLLNSGDGAIAGFGSWSIGMTGNVAIAMTASLPPLWPLATATGISAGSLFVAVRDPTLGPADAVGAIMQPMFFTLAGVLVTHAIVRAWRDTTSAFDTARHARAQALLAEVRELADIEQASRLGTDLGAFLRNAADGTAKLDDPRVQREALVLAERVRDELQYPGAWSTELRHALDAARRRGGTIRIRSVASTPGPPRPIAWWGRSSPTGSGAGDRHDRRDGRLHPCARRGRAPVAAAPRGRPRGHGQDDRAGHYDTSRLRCRRHRRRPEPIEVIDRDNSPAPGCRR